MIFGLRGSTDGRSHAEKRKFAERTGVWERPMDCNFRKLRNFISEIVQYSLSDAFQMTKGIQIKGAPVLYLRLLSPCRIGTQLAASMRVLVPFLLWFVHAWLLILLFTAVLQEVGTRHYVSPVLILGYLLKCCTCNYALR